MADPDEAVIHCSFCGKSQHEVRKLIAGQQAFICDECIALCTVMAGSDDLPPGATEDEKDPGDAGG